MDTTPRHTNSEAHPAESPRGPFTVQDLDFDLPEDLIAQHPPATRDQARLLLVDRKTGQLQDLRITDLPNLLNAGDLLVLNDTKVLPAKFVARRKSGGKVEGLFVRQDRPDQWLVMMQSSGRLKPDERLMLPSKNGSVVRITIIDRDGEGLWRLGFDFDAPAAEILEHSGETPLPPYIRRRGSQEHELEDRERYQTVYAAQTGSVAAPTAGLHFTQDILRQLHDRGVHQATLTLHVGIGTFRPIRVDRLDEHKMHSEPYTVPAKTIEAIQSTKRNGGRIIAVGTTSTRVLESVASHMQASRIIEAPSISPSPSWGEGRGEGLSTITGQTDIFIYPPYKFQIVDALLTNFHLPRSTLLGLVMAFAGIDLTRRVYQHAVKERYRFFSYGDAMLIT